MDTRTNVRVDGKPAALLRKSGAAGPIRDSGALIINADDWGRDSETTDKTLDCLRAGALSSVSAMVFMEDSGRAAGLARENGVDTGLHLNFTLGFSAPETPPGLLEHQHRVSCYLRAHRFAPVLFHPGLMSSFEYILSAQRDEFARLYGAEPARVDGHHHMHLCSNVLLGGLIAPGTLVRRSFSFQRGEKSGLNRFYRHLVDRKLARRHRLTDFFFSLPPLHPVERLQKIFGLSRTAAVEVETHPANPEEHRFLAGGEIFRWIGEIRVAPRFALPRASAVA